MNEIPSEWRMWLKHFRQDPPTQEEILTSQFEQQSTRENAKIVDARDREVKSQEVKSGTEREIEEFDPTK
eukprot:758341-Hanusia_phi.AAC.2